MRYKVIERILVISTLPNGDTVELNRIQWDGGDIVFDLRKWKPDGRPSPKGFRLDKEHISLIKEALMARDEL